MNSTKATLDDLRIDRRAALPRGKAAWMGVRMLLLGLLLLGGAWWFHRPSATEVRTAVAREKAAGAAKTLLNASGYVTARRAATVSSKVTGKVVEVKIEEGMKVEAGQELASLDSANVKASLRLAEAQLGSAKAAMGETRPNVVFAQQELKRFTDLAATKAVSDSDLRRRESEARALDAHLIKQEAEIEVAESEVAQWRQQVDDTIIRAPFSGVVTLKNAQPGEMISPMSSGGFTRTGICTIVDMTSLEIEVDVNESFINRITPGQPVEARLDAYADWQIPAKVIAIIPTADRQKATVKVRVGFDQLDPRILPEMGVKVAFHNAEGAAQKPAGGSIAIPKSALQQIDGRDVVWVMRDGRVERRAVTVAQTDGDETLIGAGVSGGESVVADPPPGLTDGTRVVEKKP